MKKKEHRSKAVVILTLICQFSLLQAASQGQIIVDGLIVDTIDAVDGLVDGGTVLITGPAGAIVIPGDADGVSLTTNQGGTGVTVTVDPGRSITINGANSGIGINLGSGTATNSGTITTNGATLSSGISILNVTGGDITNNGAITTNGTGALTYSDGNHGIRINQGNVINNGSITTAGTFSAGIAIDPDQLGGPGGNVSNFGTITTTGNNSPGILNFAGGNITNEVGATITTSGTFTSSFVDGMLLTGNSSSIATNNGTININGAGNFGLLIGGITTQGGATAINNGTINLNANAIDGGERNAGLYSFGGSSSLTNSSTGIINVDSVNSSGFGAALGSNTMLNDGQIIINPTNPTGIVDPVTNGMLGSTAGGDTITNSATGTITVDANGNGIANGMNSAGGNTLVNEGAITLNATNSNGITSTGNDTVTNAATGVITTNAATNNGMNLSGGATGTNQGTINVQNGTDNAGALLSGATSTTFANTSSGTINLRAPSSNAIESEGGGAGHILVNDGTINSGTGPAAPGSNAFVVGMGDNATNNGTINTSDAGSTGFNTFEAGATIINNGTINTTDTGVAGAANSINDTLGATSILNAGTINNSSNGGNGILSASTMITNSGAINLTGDDAGTLNAIQTTGTGATIIHSGTITNTSPGGGLAHGIFLNGTGDTVNLLAGSRIDVAADGSLAFRNTNAFDHTINITGATLTNNNAPGNTLALLGAGDDVINITGGFRITGILDMGGNTAVGDTLNVSNIIATQDIVDGIRMKAGAPLASPDFVPVPGGLLEWADVENLNFDLSTIFSAQTVLPDTLKDFGDKVDRADLLVDPDLQRIITAFSNVPRSEFTDIARTLSGQSTFDAMTSIQFNANTQFTNAFFRRLGDFQGSNPINNFNGFTLHDANMPTLLASTNQALTASSAMRAASDSYSSAASSLLSAMTLSEMLELEVERDEIIEKRFVTDLIGYGTYAEQDGTSERPEGHYYLANATLRAGYRVTNDLTAGAYAGYNHTQAETDNSGSELQNMGGHVGGFIDYRYKQFRISGLAGYTYSSYDSERKLIFGGLNRQATADTTGHQIMLAGEATYDFIIDKDKTWTVSPILGMHFAHHWIDGYTESGAGAANLTVEDQSAQSLQSKVGAEASKSFYYGIENRITVFGNAFYHREFLDDGRDVDVAFNSAGIGAFTVQTEDPERDFFTLGLGFEAQPFTNPYLRITGGYQHQLGQDGFSAHNLYGGARYDF